VQTKRFLYSPWQREAAATREEDEMGDPIIQLDDEKIQEIVGWLRENYAEIQLACEERDLPKPPNW
jgi:hypothetical protein